MDDPILGCERLEEHHMEQQYRSLDASILRTVICFHGSGENPLPSWEGFTSIAEAEYTTVLLDRGIQKKSLAEMNAALLNHLKTKQLNPPYILVAHSYGGAFAKMFLYQYPEMVAGMVLVETGQEGGLSETVEKRLLGMSPLGKRPLSVIRGNSLIKSWETLTLAEKTADTDGARTDLERQRRMLELCDSEDERLKKAQLQMSKVTKYVHLPDCGHGVIRDRPDVVLSELRWVTANLQPVPARTNFWTRIRHFLSASSSR